MKQKEKLISILMNRYKAKRQSNGVWYTISCPFCGDSPNPHTRHCNIRVSANDNAMIVHCFQLKCHASGVMNKNHLLKMGILDSELLEFVESNKVSTHELISQEINSETKYNLETSINQKVQDYFYLRVKKDLDLSMKLRYRIVEDLDSFVEINKDILPESVQTTLLGYPYEAIGFLNPTGSNILLRAIDEGIDKNKRFLRYSLMDTSKISRFAIHKPYIIERENDYVGDDRYITICEGPFDLINTMEYIMPDNKGLWIAGNVSNQKGFIKSITKYYPYRHIVYIADSDVDDRYIRSFFKDIRYRVEDVFVVRNKASKDVGDMSEPMDIFKYKI